MDFAGAASAGAASAGAGSTVTAQSAVYVTPSTVIEAVTVHVPAEVGEIVPFETLAFEVSELFQVTVDPAGLTVAVIVAFVFGSVTVAV